MRRLLSAAAAVTMLVALHPMPAAALFTKPQQQLFFSVAVTGTPNPYTLYLRANDVGPGSNDSIEVWFGRTAPNGNKPQQVHDYYVSGATVSCATGLATCDINSGTQMGSLGQIHLTYAASTPVATTHHTCPNSFQSVYNESRRNGHATGTFLLKTGTSYFKTIRNTSSAAVHIPASITTRASKFTYGSDCGPGGPCATDVSLNVSTFAGSLGTTQFKNSGLGRVDFEASDPEVASTSIRHTVFGQARVTVLQVTQNSPKSLQKISLSIPFQPFITGSGTFTGSGDATVSNFAGCREVDRSGSFSGNFSAQFDGWGIRSFSGGNPANAQRLIAQP